jgi:hypothetical protein
VLELRKQEGKVFDSIHVRQESCQNEIDESDLQNEKHVTKEPEHSQESFSLIWCRDTESFSYEMNQEWNLIPQKHVSCLIQSRSKHWKYMKIPNIYRMICAP